MGKLVVVNVLALAEADPLVGVWYSGVLKVVTVGIELVVVIRLGRPGWKCAPAARPRLLEPFLIGDRLPFAS